MLDKAIQDFDYNEQKVLTELHILPGQFEEEDFYRLNEVLSALPAEERVQSGHDFMASLGITQNSDGSGQI